MIEYVLFPLLVSFIVYIIVMVSISLYKFYRSSKRIKHIYLKKNLKSILKVLFSFGPENWIHLSNDTPLTKLINVYFLDQTNKKSLNDIEKYLIQKNILLMKENYASSILKEIIELLIKEQFKNAKYFYNFHKILTNEYQNTKIKEFFNKLGLVTVYNSDSFVTLNLLEINFNYSHYESFSLAFFKVLENNETKKIIKKENKIKNYTEFTFSKFVFLFLKEAVEIRKVNFREKSFKCGYNRFRLRAVYFNNLRNKKGELFGERGWTDEEILKMDVIKEKYDKSTISFMIYERIN